MHCTKECELFQHCGVEKTFQFFVIIIMLVDACIGEGKCDGLLKCRCSPSLNDMSISSITYNALQVHAVFCNFAYMITPSLTSVQLTC